VSKAVHIHYPLRAAWKQPIPLPKERARGTSSCSKLTAAHPEARRLRRHTHANECPRSLGSASLQPGKKFRRDDPDWWHGRLPGIRAPCDSSCRKAVQAVGLVLVSPNQRHIFKSLGAGGLHWSLIVAEALFWGVQGCPPGCGLCYTRRPRFSL
jgi:hypothetical protein